jgi:hypothetical protein
MLSRNSGLRRAGEVLETRNHAGGDAGEKDGQQIGAWLSGVVQCGEMREYSRVEDG